MNIFFVQNPIYKFIPFQILAITIASNFHIPIYIVLWMLAVSTLLSFTQYYNIFIPLTIIALTISVWEFRYPPTNISQYDEMFVELKAEIIKVQKTQRQINYVLNDMGVGLLYSVNDSLNAIVEDSLHLRGELYVPTQARNPGQFNLQKYYASKGIDVIFDNDTELIQVMNTSNSTNKFIFNIRQWVIGVIYSYITSPYSGLAMGLLIGDKSDITTEVKEKFKSSGIIHILAVSGLHVGYILLVLTIVGRLFQFPPILKFLLIVFGLHFYMALTGWPISVIRAGYMGILYAYAQLKEYKTHHWNILGVVAFISLLIDPIQLFSLSFQLSFGAVAGILYSNGQFQQWWNARSFSENYKLKWICNFTVVSLGAQMGTFLPIVYYFGKIPIWSVLFNFIAIPLSAIAVILGIILLIISPLIPFITLVYAKTLTLSLFILDYSISIIQLMPMSYMNIHSQHYISIILLFFLFLSLMSFSSTRYFQHIIILSLIFLNFTIYDKVLEDDEVKFVFFDVGQGDACLIYDKHHSILIDAGYAGFGKDYGKTVIFPYLQSKGIKQIDVAILSHPHADHIGGLHHLLKNIKIHEIWDTYHQYDSRLIHSILDVADSTNTTINYPQPGESYILGDLSVVVLYPNKSISSKVNNVNDASIVVRIDHGENSFLFTGDAEKFAEHIYGKLGEYLDVDVVKVGHHGSKTSSSQKIIDSTSADAIVVSLGKHNKYGHPSTTILENWEKSGVEIFRTDLHGAIIMDSNGEDIKISKMID